MNTQTMPSFLVQVYEDKTMKNKMKSESHVLKTENS